MKTVGWSTAVCGFAFLLPPFAFSAETLTFESDILPILESNCLTCHGMASPQADLDLRSLASILKGGKSGVAIVAGSSGTSLLMEKVASGSMPLGGDRLAPEDIKKIRNWIDRGAPSGSTADRSLTQATGAVPASPLTEHDVLPIFQVRCIACHGKRKQEGGVDLRTLAGRLKGGDAGPALVPGKPEESRLIQRIVSGECPPFELQLELSVRPPTTLELDQLRQWIAGGASAGPERLAEVDSPNDPLIKDRDRDFWSFQPPTRPSPPQVRQQHLAGNPIDAFLLEKLEEKTLTFSPQAEPLKLLRRAYLDLIGMPPSPAEVKGYLKDRKPDAYERMIDRLLSSPHYGERWGRYWLDLAGYSDSEGFGAHDRLRHYAWRYRDYVIRSFNSDKPYSQFLMEQIAGDELADSKQEKEITQQVIDRLAATGFLRMAADPTDAPERAFINERMNIIADVVQVLTSSVMGLTIGCARCHDHKYDPIPQRDYYRLSAILQTAYDPYDWLPPSKRIVEMGLEIEKKERAAFNAPIEAQLEKLEPTFAADEKPYREKLLNETLDRLPEAVRKDVLALAEVPDDERSQVQKYLAKKFKDVLQPTPAFLMETFPELKAKTESLFMEINRLKAKLRPEPRIRVLADTGGEPSVSYLLLRGDPLSPGERVEPGVPSVLKAGLEPYRVRLPWPEASTSGRRLALARWLTQPDHPLTTRVIVNQIWTRHFGRGLVSTPSNFGRSGAPPSHPELLDWLATEFVREGWGIKAMHRLIMTSNAYRQSSKVSAETLATDPENVLCSRMPLRRMDAEALYDSILKATGLLDPAPFGPPEEIEVKSNKEVVAKGSKNGFRRSLYVSQRRQTPITLLDAYDLPHMTPNCLQRRESIVATQALHMMNGSVIWEHSRYMAGRVIDEVGPDREKQVKQVYLRALSRPPTSSETEQGVSALEEFKAHWPARLESDRIDTPKGWTSRWLALAGLCHTILNSAEFSFID